MNSGAALAGDFSKERLQRRLATISSVVVSHDRGERILSLTIRDNRLLAPWSSGYCSGSEIDVTLKGPKDFDISGIREGTSLSVFLDGRGNPVQAFIGGINFMGRSADAPRLGMPRSSLKVEGPQTFRFE